MSDKDYETCFFLVAALSFFHFLHSIMGAKWNKMLGCFPELT